MENNTNILNRKLWIGLDSYGENDSDIFFGREEETQSLAGDILHNVQTVVYGQSGTGKTSLIRAGVFEFVRRNRVLPVYIRLKHEDVEPSNYVKQVIDAIETEAKLQKIDIEQTAPYISVYDGKKVCLSIWEYFHCNEFWNSENFPVTPLMVLDQFEEIFTLCKDKKLQDAFFEQLSDLCDNKYPIYIRDYINDRKNERIEYSDEINYRLVLSLREDFLARLEERAENIPSLKRNRFSLRCTNEEQALEIITKPDPDIVSEEVAIQIIERVTNKKYGKDFKLHDGPDIDVEPSILSLFCSELDKRRRERGMDFISSELIGEFGDNIIRDFYLESIKNLSEEKVEYLEKQLLTVDGFRDAVALQNAKRFGFTDEEIESLTAKRIIRKDEWDGAVRLEFTHDVLCKVALSHRIQCEQEKEQLRIQLEEQKKSETERKRQEAERERLLRQQQLTRRKMKRVIIGSVTALSLFFAIWLFYAYWTIWEYSESYASFIRVNGWPTGVGEPLSKEDCNTLNVYYKLSKSGRNTNTPFDKVEVCSRGRIIIPSFTTPIVGDNEKDDVKAYNFSVLKKRTRYILFTGVGDEKQDGVSKETYYDEKDNPLYSISYFRPSQGSVGDEGDKRLRNIYMWALFCDANGTAMEVRDNGADRMRVLVDSSGCEIKYTFYNSSESPRDNYIGSYGFEVVYKNDEKNRTIDTLRHLNQFGDVTMIEVRSLGKRSASQSFFNADGTAPFLFEGKYARRVSEFDRHGSIIRCKYFNEDYKLLSNGQVAIEERTYDPQGRLSKIIYKDCGGKQIRKRGGSNNYTYTEFFYDAKDKTGTPYRECRYLGKAKVYESLNTDTAKILDDAYSGYYLHEQVEYLSDTKEKHVFLNKEGHPIRDVSEGYCYRTVEKTKMDDGICIVSKTFDVDESLTDVGGFATDSSFFNNEGNIVKQFRFNSFNKPVLYMGYEYADGMERCRYALSLDGKTPIRCPHLEADNMSYYKLKEARNSVQIFPLAFVKAVSEYPNCNSFVMRGIKKGGYEFSIGKETEMGNGWKLQNILVLSFPELSSSTYKVAYLHITDLKGEAYKKGLRDGDLLIRCGTWDYSSSFSEASLSSLLVDNVQQHIEVIRFGAGKWSKLVFSLSRGDKGVEVYPIFYTEEEYKFFQQGLQDLR